MYETIKKTLDESCSQELNEKLKIYRHRHPRLDEWELTYDYWNKTECEHRGHNSECWQCQKNTGLAHKIADDLEFAKEGK
jgi:hypothetical protein